MDAALNFEKGATVRQYHNSTRLRYDDAVIKHVHPNGGLDVIGADGAQYGWSVNHCEVVKAAPAGYQGERQPAAKAPRRPLLHRLFGVGLGRPNLITVWVEVVGRYSHGQVETEHKVKLGRYTVLSWTRFYTPWDDQDGKV